MESLINGKKLKLANRRSFLLLHTSLYSRSKLLTGKLTFLMLIHKNRIHVYLYITQLCWFSVTTEDFEIFITSARP